MTLIKLLFFSVISTKQTSQKKKCCCQQAQEMGLKGLLFSADEWCVEHRSVQSPSWGEFIIPRTMEEEMSVQFYQCLCRQTDGVMDFCWFGWLWRKCSVVLLAHLHHSSMWVSDLTLIILLLVIQKYTNSMQFIQIIYWIRFHILNKFGYFWGASKVKNMHVV